MKQNDKFGMLTVIKRTENIKGHVMILCKCDCGNEKVVRRSHLLNCEVISCGCHKKDICKSFGEKRKLKNEYTICGEYAIGRDNNGNKFKVSICDLEKVKKSYWYHDSHGYFRAERNGITIRMHRIILKTNKVVDHINGDRGDNRRENLRECTEEQNAFNKGIHHRNTSGYPGVYFHKTNKKWVAYINYKGQRINIGSFTNKNEAIQARMDAEEKYFGEFTRKNILESKDDLLEGKY
ncbi:HNH endonuclease [Clostridium pasteurianum]|nr:HNH endonuclease [Clostridium pasteurianum]